MYTTDLNGNWLLNRVDANKNDQPIIDLPATVPGTVYTDLLAAELIADPFYRDNEIQTQWIGEADWQYSRNFDLDNSMLEQSDQLRLECESLDTVATVYLNGQLLGQTENQFRHYQFDITEIVKPTHNKLKIIFKSPKPIIAERMLDREAFQIADEVPWVWPGRSTIRKSPASFGWDWGPALPSCGILGAIRIIGIEQAKIAEVHIKQQHLSKNSVELDVTITTETITSNHDLTATVAVTLNNQTVAETRLPVIQSSANCQLMIDNAELWWPAGQGAQPLYKVSVKLSHKQYQLDCREQCIGLRTLRLIRKPDQWGESFYFECNGRAIFAKGGNWIPADTFVNRISHDDYRGLLTACVDANMNMVRVWGGGIYEPDIFYELCDELGLMVWQDFMANVEQELTEQIKRLRHHPALALWCGNNELEQMFGYDDDDGWNKNHMSLEDYSRLFDQLMLRLVSRFAPEHDYWPGSPHSPHGNRCDYNNPTCGDAHLWNVWFNREPFEWYRTCKHRFISEFGFQSFPEPRTVENFTLPEDRNVSSPIMEHHQRSGPGNALIIHYMLEWFRMPKDFNSLVWLSQIQHGMSMKFACEHWRRSMPRTMGTLFWQINDCWPAASWSSIDYHGRWKAFLYMTKKFYAPVLLTISEADDMSSAGLHISSDCPTASQAVLNWCLTELNGNIILADSSTVTIPALASELVHTVELQSYIERYGKENLLLWCELRNSDGTLLSDNLLLPVRPKRMALLDPKLQAVIIQHSPHEFSLTVTGEYVALWVVVEFKALELKLSDNFFHLRPGNPISLILTSKEPLTIDTIEQDLKLSSLWHFS